MITILWFVKQMALELQNAKHLFSNVKGKKQTTSIHCIKSVKPTLFKRFEFCKIYLKKFLALTKTAFI